MMPGSYTIPEPDKTSRILNDHIEKIVVNLLREKDSEKQAGLLTGKAGMVLLFAYLSKVFPDKNYTEHTFNFLNDLGDALANEELDYHLTTGVAGLAFAFQHLRNIGILDMKEDMNLAELDGYLAQGVERDYAEQNWDPLHGMVGLGIYFLERFKETGDAQYLEKIVDYLALMRVAKGDCQIWVTPGYENYSEDNYNFGMAHGMSGILSFLSQVAITGIRQQEIKAMVSSAIPYFLVNELADESVCRFPIYVDAIQGGSPNDSFSRLGWCYGDLCPALTFIHCGKAFNNKEWIDKGIQIAIRTTSRDFSNAGCIDPPLCHGSVGLIHQYNRLFMFTGMPEFKKAAEYWVEMTLQKFYKPKEFKAGYFSGVFNNKTNAFDSEERSGILEGNAGIALIYLSYLYPVKPDWDIIFLTNV